MQNTAELIIVHGKEWLMGVAALGWVALQWKRTLSRPQSAPATSRASDTLPAASAEAPAASLAKAWRRAVWRVVRLDLAQVAAMLGLLGWHLTEPAPASVGMVARPMLLSVLGLMSWVSMLNGLLHLRLRWAAGARE